MGQTTSYSTIVSPRSRRLRTIGLVLLATVVLMVIYGYFGLMPALRRSVHVDSTPSSFSHNSAVENGSQTDSTQSDHERRIRKLKASAGLAYWGVCSLLLVGAVFVAWLDLREISRNYVAERRAMWTQAADRIKSTDDTS
jgi:hypothetical protein